MFNCSTRLTYVVPRALFTDAAKIGLFITLITLARVRCAKRFVWILLATV
jgi:hypothetical protein